MLSTRGISKTVSWKTFWAGPSPTLAVGSFGGVLLDFPVPLELLFSASFSIPTPPFLFFRDGCVRAWINMRAAARLWIFFRVWMRCGEKKEEVSPPPSGSLLFDYDVEKCIFRGDVLIFFELPAGFTKFFSILLWAPSWKNLAMREYHCRRISYKLKNTLQIISIIRFYESLDVVPHSHLTQVEKLPLIYTLTQRVTEFISFVKWAWFLPLRQIDLRLLKNQPPSQIMIIINAKIHFPRLSA